MSQRLGFDGARRLTVSLRHVRFPLAPHLGSLTNNNIGDEGAVSLATSLPQCRGLKNLQVQCVGTRPKLVNLKTIFAFTHSVMGHSEFSWSQH